MGANIDAFLKPGSVILKTFRLILGHFMKEKWLSMEA